MTCRLFEITLISAVNLKDVRKIFNMEVHARVSIGGGDEIRTPVDRHGLSNPAWNFTMNYTINEAAIHYQNAMLVIKLYCSRILGDRYIGEVHMTMKELYENCCNSGGSAVVILPVQKGSVNSRGELKFSYRFGERVMMVVNGFGAWT